MKKRAKLTHKPAGVISLPSGKTQPAAKPTMGKTIFTLIAALTLLLRTLSATAADQAAPPRVAVLIPDALRAELQTVKGLRDGVKKLGYREGKNVIVEVRNAKGDRGALKTMAAAIVSEKFNVIFATGTRATQAAKEASDKIPVVFSHPADPVALGLVKSMERPGGNVTGVAAFAVEMTGKRMEALREIIPQVRRIHIFYDSNNKFSQQNFSSAQKDAAKLGLEVVPHPVKSADEFKTSLSQLEKDDTDVMFHVPDDLIEGEADFIFEQARQNDLPTMFNEEVWVVKGALAGLGPSYYHMGLQAAVLVDKILKGQSPQSLPVERARKFDLVINMRTAKAIGLTISRAVVKKADKRIY